ncbi:MAG: hypothetical protein ACK5M3_02630 [Dysgonomonas sp.]
MDFFSYIIFDLILDSAQWIEKKIRQLFFKVIGREDIIEYINKEKDTASGCVNLIIGGIILIAIFWGIIHLLQSY